MYVVPKKALDNDKQHGLTIEKLKRSRYPETCMTDDDYTDDLAITSNNNKDV